MSNIRRSLLLVSLERYSCAAIAFISLPVTARLMTPAEIGIATLCVGIIGVVESLREFGTSTYLIQHQNLATDNIRTAFTIMLGITLALVGILWLAAKPIAAFFDTEAVETYLHLAVLGLLFGPFLSTVSALLRREMAFGKLALIGISCAIVQTMTLIVLAMNGFSYMSFAWAGLSYGLCAIVMMFAVGADFSNFRISLVEWEQSVKFAAYDSATALLNRVWEMLPSFVFGRILGVDAVGLYSRAGLICQWPEKILFAGLAPVLLPAFASGARAGRSLKDAYLRSIEYITVLQWPALVMLILLAHPIVHLLLGERWLETVPLVRILAGAMLTWFPAYLTYPSLVAAGAISDTLRSTLISLPISAVILCLAAPHGLMLVALSMFVIMPLQVAVALVFVKRRVQFSCWEFLRALRKSFFVAISSATGPLLCLLLFHFRPESSWRDAAAIAGLGGFGWLLGVWCFGHPVLRELGDARTMLVERLALRRAGELKGAHILQRNAKPSDNENRAKTPA